MIRTAVTGLAVIAFIAITEDGGCFTNSQWTDRVIPLPRQIWVSGATRVRAAEMAVECSDPKSAQSRTAVGLLRAFCLSKGKERSFTIRLLLAGSARGYADKRLLDRLASLPNDDQAYHIEPSPGRDELIVVANTSVGLLFAARTLVQLVAAPGNTRSLTTLEIPWVTITDWPDIGERGQWGGDVTVHASVTAKYKLNVIEHSAKVSVDEGGKPVCKTSADWVADNLALGVKIVPYISHLEQISRYTGLGNRSDVISKPNPSKPLPSDYVPGLCMSSLATREIVRGWLDKIAQIEGVTDIMVWLSEYPNACFCDSCSGRDPYELEVEAITGAFQQVKRMHPEARLRLLTTQGSFNVNDRILAAVPSDVGVSYYDGGRTYDSSRRPMIYPLLEDFARSGRWLGVYPQITHSWRTVFPWIAPQFIRCRAQEFADKKLSNVIGYAVPSNYCHDFNVLALAEWAWNSHGRTPKEFARVYALQRGIRNPDLFAEWALLAGDAGWSLAESRLMLTAIYNPTFGLLSGAEFDHRMQHASILDTGKLDDAISTARRALDLAIQHGDPDMISESRCALAGLESFQAVRTISEALSSPAAGRLSASLDTLDRTAEQIRDEVRDWGERVRKRAKWSKLPSRLIDTAHALLRTCDGFRARAVELGVPDPHPERRLARVGEWSADDFKKGPEATLKWDVSALVPSDGAACNIAFDFVWSSAYGTDMKAVRIIEALGDTEKVISVSDDPLGRLSRFEPHKEALLTIPARSDTSRLFVELDCVGQPADAPPDRRSCSGKVSIRQVSPGL